MEVTILWILILCLINILRLLNAPPLLRDWDEALPLGKRHVDLTLDVVHVLGEELV